MKKQNFEADVKLGKSVHETISFELNNESELSLTWDDVYDKAVETAESRFSEDDFPHMSIERMFIITKEGTFPVVAEDEDVKNLKSVYERVLVLPYARYSLTPEYKAFLTLSERGLISGDFDLDAMRTILDAAKDTEE